MKREQLYISTIAADAAATAREHGLGLEIAEYCTAWNMDEHFPETDAAVRREMTGIPHRILHAPFNELFPCAVDPRARALAEERYRQAIALAKTYGAEKVVIHGGYNPRIYYPVWYTEQSVRFWREFVHGLDVPVVLENVLEEEPGLLRDIIAAVDHPLLRLCLDIGHVNAYSGIPAEKWLEECAPWLGHFHIHNNDAFSDGHLALPEGTIPMERFLRRAKELCPEATFTLEVTEAGSSVRWLTGRGLL